MKPENETSAEDKTFENAEAAVAEAINAIPEAASDNLLAALTAYYETGGAYEDLTEAVNKAMEKTFEIAEAPPEETKRNETFGAAICALLCALENEGGNIAFEEKRNLEKAARAAYVESGSKTAFAVINQFDIFEDIG